MHASPVAIITGAGRGLGRIMALHLARDGFAVVLAAPDTADLTQVAVDVEALGRRSLAVVTDVRREDQVQALAARAREEFGRIDLLVNNAAIAGPTAPLSEIARDDWDDVLAVNLTGAFLCCKAVLPDMMARCAGKIINVSSIAGKLAYALRSPYAASKWGLIGLTLTLAKEMGPYNVQVNAICPGPVRGERMQRVIEDRAAQLGQSPEQVEHAFRATMALKRFVEPEQIAAAVAYLASPAGDNITGTTLDVTAGYGL